MEWRWASSEVLKERNLIGKVVLIGFDALPEALQQVRDGNMTATVDRCRPVVQRRLRRSGVIPS
jgi:ABC-type sugar transport system substrate-binding protein